MSEHIRATSEYIQSKIETIPAIGIILGSGLGGLVKEIVTEHSLPYQSIPNFPVSTVEGHSGKLIVGNLSGKKVIAMQGRFHFYEGYTMQQVAFPVRVMKHLGIKGLIISNASGGVNPKFKIGDIMILADHINLMPSNPLIGKNDIALGPRFPDMSETYDKTMIRSALKIARKNRIRVHTGVYAGLPGPCLETPAEYLYARRIGADAVGMSTVPEVIAARHLDIPCFAISIITDMGVPGRIKKVTHADVLKAAETAEPKMTRIISELIRTIK